MRRASAWSLISRLCLLASALLACAVLRPAGARADVQIESFESLPTSTQAGGHPNVVTRFTLSSHQADPTPCACNDAKNVIASLPAGFIGNPHATPQCNVAEFSADKCPVDSQIGIAYSAVSAKAGTGNFENQAFLSPIYNMVPPPSIPGLLAFKSGGSFNTPTFEAIGSRTEGDYGLDVEVRSIEHFAPVTAVEQLIWGVPAEPANDNFRFGYEQKALFLLSLLGSHINPFCDAEGNLHTADPASIVRICPQEFAPAIEAVGEWHAGNLESEFGPGYPVPSNSPLTPFIQSPTTCGVSSLVTSLEVQSYDGGVTHADSRWPATTGCDRLAFNPSLFARPTTDEADSPAGIDVDLKAPIFESAAVPSPSEIRGTLVTLPPGFTINSAAADGKAACSDAEARFGTREEARCPEHAKLGTLEVISPVLPGVLPGAIYIGRPLAGERYRLFLTFDGFGVHVKLSGVVHPDPVTGQVITEFRDLPQFPFEDFRLHFFGGERGILATPTRCGTYPVSTEFEPWDGALPNQTSTQYFTIASGPNGSPCPEGPRPLSPGFSAASAANTAGAHTAFWLNLTRRDGEQSLTGLDVTTPPGFAATLRGVPYCPEANIAAATAAGHSGLAEQETPSCPAASLVGEAVAGAGVGTHLLHAAGKVYLAGPYEGAPLSLVVITPAVSGPYDLGAVLVRSALHVDPETAQVTAVSDPLPQILEGVQLRLRSVFVNLDRPEFALNPTNCAPLSVAAKAAGDEGGLAELAAPFQVANCANLPFAPQLSFSLKGNPRRSGNPALKAVLTMRPGEANIARAQVALPRSEFLDNANFRTICTRAEYSAGAGGGAECRPGSIYGHAVAYSPLLDEPLQGPVYLRSSSHELPDLVASLDGQIHVDLEGRIDSVNGGIRNTFEVVPDAPVSRFVLQMKGGKYGLLENSENLCEKPHRAVAKFTGQNGKVRRLRPVLRATSCHKRASAQRHHRRGGRRR